MTVETTRASPITRLSDRHGSDAAKLSVGACRLSFEFFPPKSRQQDMKLRDCMVRLSAFDPAFVSMTYGAGGTTKDRSIEMARSLMGDTGQSVAAHLTCVGASRDAVDAVAREYLAAGIGHIVALRGDPPEGIGHAFCAHEQGYATSADLVAGLKAIAPFEISVGAYCERHPESADWAAEIDGLKRKVDAGADRAITQFFFDNDLFEAYSERVRAAGISIPIVPGILPIHSYPAVLRFASRCGATVPDWVTCRLGEMVPGSDQALAEAAAMVCEQVDDLSARGVDQLHFYTMNRADILVPALVDLTTEPAARSAA